MPVQAIPDVYGSLTPYLIVKNASSAIEFYQRAFGAKERVRLDDPSGKVGHAELEIGNRRIMLADEFPEMGVRGPQASGGAGVLLLLYVADVDASFQQAVAAGATALRPLQDQFYGDRSGTVSDPYGHVWTIATHKEDVPDAEVKKRFAAMCSQHGKK